MVFGIPVSVGSWVTGLLGYWVILFFSVGLRWAVVLG